MYSSNRKLVSFDKLQSALRNKLTRAFPYGFGDAVMKIEAPTPFHAVLFEDEGMTYLVKLSPYQVNTSSIDYDDNEEEEIDISSDDLSEDVED